MQPFTPLARLKSMTFIERVTLVLSGPSCGLPAVVRITHCLSEP
jgi:hypothetical protein